MKAKLFKLKIILMKDLNRIILPLLLLISTVTYGQYDQLGNQVVSTINGIKELSQIKGDKNAKDSWNLFSLGVNLGGYGGPIAGTDIEMGQFAGLYLSATSLDRNGLSFMSSYYSIKSTFGHSFKAYDENGNSHFFIGKTEIEMPTIDFSLGKDLTGPEGSIHVFPNVGADLIFDLKNSFLSKDQQYVYEEVWKNSLFFGIHAGIQTYYLLSTRFGLQVGGKYLFFPSNTSGDIFKTAGFFYLNAGITYRIFW